MDKRRTGSFWWALGPGFVGLVVRAQAQGTDQSRVAHGPGLEGDGAASPEGFCGYLSKIIVPEGILNGAEAEAAAAVPPPRGVFR